MDAELFGDLLKACARDHGILITVVNKPPQAGWQFKLPITNDTPTIIATLITQKPDPEASRVYMQIDKDINMLCYSFVPNLQALLVLDDEKNIDFASTLERDMISGLLDGQGSVALLDFQPRIVPKDRTPEYMAVRGARTSLGAGLKSVKVDNGLLNYLFANKHTSPLELCSVTFRIKMPLVLMTQFLRHRAAKHCKVNIFSQRYAEVDDDELGVYEPLNYVDGIRGNGDLLNKQSSTTQFDANKDTIVDLIKSATEHQTAIYDLYHKMIKAGLAKEIARLFLPGAQYTTALMSFDLNNLLHLLRLRDDEHTQHETRVFAHAMYELSKPLFPTIFEAFDNERFGCTLTKTEMEALAQNSPTLDTNSKTEQEAFQTKKKRLRSI